MDVVDRVTRSRMMSGIKGKHTKPELTVRKFLHAQGYRFRLHRADLPGKPDIVLPRYRTCIFVQGCFWHQHPGCKYAHTPKSNQDFWLPKLAKNVQRDQISERKLKEMGWQVVIIWECDTKNREILQARIREALGPSISA
ncbi:very short patch repair endonuclease [Pseudomonas synxantha]|uniref:very short patch repair endonuclease n=1 Tax=Pseudomonas synxantha TaxID=47883 RepID=UPI002794FC43|nr:DNA mismatch endonuclease Vsr [Pseudomonas synxantha]MDQ0976854.1 DNA mismatch endonuclease (patch repair protein) [Pseudomonas synxantha]